MGNYITGSRIILDLTLVKVHEYLNKFSYHPSSAYIYIFKDAEDVMLAWKTTSVIGLDIEKENGIVEFVPVFRGDKIRVTASIKGEDQYNGDPQVVITRVKVNEIIEKALTKADKIRMKKEEQLASLGEGDFIWQMPYRQYKAHYSDCEILAGSYSDHNAKGEMIHPVITVIIRDGRLKASGVRGKHFSGWEFINELKNFVCYRAVSEENALKRCQKDFPGHQWELNKIYR